ncbi:hypothetical protein QTO34_015181 [Cnephaeus nilssonii]|uniref:HTH psq-type domain-containing protein n=1 Tax=Cnephaeus nilssonii TaxID=3371016 RepID=A0AA40I3M9_CNENI|nr:hypothetical protein QTO34_015181 [Eptesicus nilssonii]
MALAPLAPTTGSGPNHSVPSVGVSRAGTISAWEWQGTGGHSRRGRAGPLHLLRQNNVEIGPINNPIMTSKCPSKRKSCMFLTLNQKLELSKLSEESMSKAKLGKSPLTVQL